MARRLQQESEDTQPSQSKFQPAFLVLLPGVIELCITCIDDENVKDNGSRECYFKRSIY